MTGFPASLSEAAGSRKTKVDCALIRQLPGWWEM